MSSTNGITHKPHADCHKPHEHKEKASAQPPNTRKVIAFGKTLYIPISDQGSKAAKLGSATEKTITSSTASISEPPAELKTAEPPTPIPAPKETDPKPKTQKKGVDFASLAYAKTAAQKMREKGIKAQRAQEPSEPDDTTFTSHAISKSAEPAGAKKSAQPLKQSTDANYVVPIPLSGGGKKPLEAPNLDESKQADSQKDAQITQLAKSHFPPISFNGSPNGNSPARSPERTPNGTPRQMGSDQPVAIPRRVKNGSGSNTPAPPTASPIESPAASPKIFTPSGTSKQYGTLPASFSKKETPPASTTDLTQAISQTTITTPSTEQIVKTNVTPRKVTPPPSTLNLTQVSPEPTVAAPPAEQIVTVDATPRKATPPTSITDLVQADPQPAATAPPAEQIVTVDATPRKVTPPPSTLSLAQVTPETIVAAPSVEQIMTVDATPRKATPPTSTTDLIQADPQPAVTAPPAEQIVTVDATPRKVTPPPSTLNLAQVTPETIVVAPSVEQIMTVDATPRKATPPPSTIDLTQAGSQPAVTTLPSPEQTLRSNDLEERKTQPTNAKQTLRRMTDVGSSPAPIVTTRLSREDLHASPSPEASDSKESSPAGSQRRKKQPRAPGISFSTFSPLDFSQFDSIPGLSDAMKEAVDSVITKKPLKAPIYTPRPTPQKLREKGEPSLGDTLDAAELNALFPNKKQAPQQLLTTNTNEPEDLEQLKLTPILPSPNEILEIPMNKETVTKVKILYLFGCSITDKQLEAIGKKFSALEKLILIVCPNISDSGIASLGTLRELRALEIRSCQKIKAIGIEALPLDRLEEFTLSTEEFVTRSIVEKLARSAVLKRIEFALCTRLFPGPLLGLTGARTDGPITLILKGCEQINVETFKSTLNQQSKAQIRVEASSLDLQESPSLPEVVPQFNPPSAPPPATFKASAVPPPEFPESEAIFSRKTLPRYFGKDIQKIPDHSAIIDKFVDTELLEKQLKDPEIKEKHKKEIAARLKDFKTQYPDFRDFIGFDLTGEFSNDSLRALADRFPKMEMVRIWDNPGLSTPEVINSLLKIKKLFLGNISVPVRRFDLIFSKKKDEAAWNELEELHLVLVPISDETLAFLSKLPNLREITLDHCSHFTFQGLKHLMRCNTLRKLTLNECPAIDPFAFEQFKTVRPDVALAPERSLFDPSATKLAIEEAEERIKKGANRFGVYEKLNNVMHPKSLEEETQAFYSPKLQLIGIEYEIDPNRDLLAQWLRYDQILQSYVDIHRSCWAIRKELIEVGFFTPGDQEKPPYTAQELIQYVDPTVENAIAGTTETPFPLTANERRRKIKKIDFFELEIFNLPSFIERSGYWEQVRSIDLRGNFIPEAPPSLKSLCPNLGKFSEEATELSLENRPGTNTKMIEDLFLKDLDLKPWQQLTRVELKDVPLSDQAMNGISLLPRLETLHIESCRRWTVQGLKRLMKGAPFLKKLTLLDCPGIDLLGVDEFRKTRQNVEVEAVLPPDLSALELAKEEACRRMNSPAEVKKDYFIPDHKTHPDIPSIVKYYDQQLNRIGGSFVLDNGQDTHMQFVLCDQILQGYHNFHRAARAIRKEWIRAGVFKGKKPPITTKEIVDLLSEPDESGTYYRDYVEQLDFEGLDLTYIPPFVENEHWEKVRSIKLEGNLAVLSEKLKSHCPHLESEEEEKERMEESSSHLLIVDDRKSEGKLMAFWKKLITPKPSNSL